MRGGGAGAEVFATPVSFAATSLVLFEAGPLGVAMPTAGGPLRAAAGAVVPELEPDELDAVPASIIAEITGSLTPAFFSATNPSVERSKRVFDFLIFAMITSSESFALVS